MGPKWEVSIIEFQQNGKILYKVTRRKPEFAVAETKIFESKEQAKKLFNQWLE